MEDGYTTTADVRGTWIHQGTPKSEKFCCSVCGGTVYWPQANRVRSENAEKYRLVIKYPYCPWCLKHMNTIGLD